VQKIVSLSSTPSEAFRLFQGRRASSRSRPLQARLPNSQMQRRWPPGNRHPNTSFPLQAVSNVSSASFLKSTKSISSTTWS
jgi:hypothetical protein